MMNSACRYDRARCIGDRCQSVAIRDVHAHQTYVGVLQNVRLCVVGCVIVHRAIIQARLQDCSGPGSSRLVIEIFRLLIAAGADPNAPGPRNWTALGCLVLGGQMPDDIRLPVAELLLNAGARTDIAEKDGH